MSASEEIDVAQNPADQRRVLGAEATALHRLLQVGGLGTQAAACARSASTCGSRWPAISASSIDLPARRDVAGHAVRLDPVSSRVLCLRVSRSPGHARAASPAAGRLAAALRQDRFGGTKLGSFQQPELEAGTGTAAPSGRRRSLRPGDVLDVRRIAQQQLQTRPPGSPNPASSTRRWLSIATVRDAQPGRPVTQPERPPPVVLNSAHLLTAPTRPWPGVRRRPHAVTCEACGRPSAAGRSSASIHRTSPNRDHHNVAAHGGPATTDRSVHLVNVLKAQSAHPGKELRAKLSNGPRNRAPTKKARRNSDGPAILPIFTTPAWPVTAPGT